MKPTIAALLLSTAASGATIQDVRDTFISDCAGRGAQKGDPKAIEFCACSFNVFEDKLTLGEYKEVERYISERRSPDTLPQIKRVWPLLNACKK